MNPKQMGSFGGTPRAFGGEGLNPDASFANDDMNQTRFLQPLLLLAALLFLGAGPAHAQTAVLVGQVLDRETRTPLAGALVVVEPGGIQAITDAQGRFRVEGVPPGMVSVRATTLGYAPILETAVMARTSRATYVPLDMRPAAIQLEGLVVEADVFRAEDDAPTSNQRLTEVEIRRTPGGLGDISRSLLSLPGVLGGVDNRNDLLVRGGGPGENAYYLDGIRIPQINHFATQGTAGGALALVNADFIQDATFFTGGFPTKYGDALSSVLLIETRPGSEDGVAGDVTLGASEAGVTLDGPIGSSATWLFSVRRSYLQFLFEALDLPIRPDYWDAQASLKWSPSPRDKVTLTAVGAIDDFGIVAPGPNSDFENQEIFESVIDNDQKAFTFGGTWQRLVGDGSLIQGTASHSRTDYQFVDDDPTETPLVTNRSVESRTRLGVMVESSIAPNLRMSGGVELVRNGIDSRVFQRAIPGGLLPADIEFSSEGSFLQPGLWAQGVWRPGRLTATVGVRGDGVSVLDKPWSFGPRASLRVATTDNLDLSLSGGWFHQAPSALALAVEEDGSPVNHSLQQLRNWQVVAGVDWLLTPGRRLRVETFYKDYDRMPVLESDPRINLANLGDDYGFVGAEPLLSEGSGRAYGGELFFQQKLTGSAYLLGAYTLAWSEYAGTDGVLKPSSWDRRHSLDLTGGYRIGDRWEVGTKLRILSGVAFTPWDLEASAQTYPLTGRGVQDWARVGEERSPGYARLDLRIEREWFFEAWDAVVYLDIQNLLGRENSLGFSYTEDPAYPSRLRPIDGIGLLPTFGFSIEF